ncbi:hypothetical protein [Actinomycetospora termitidis]|uniref:MFS transporter n=1 Tax=Actinomycetospora termitidis TaxID=3053470 RepID=A0ABT7M5F3_9PSEU|nr:hypothetical protein [Actinomycetospora sp. Odt1-22]MDL5155870.1 hypothetical protein [Actinomycetospora sp. Odt1-22]
MRTNGHKADTGLRRVPVAAALATALALGAHLVGGGARPTGIVLTVVVALSAAVSLVALRTGRVCRGPWTALAVLILGQVALEAVLAAADHHVVTAVAALGVHGAAALAAALLLLGGARLADDLRDAADRVLVRRWWCRPEPTSATRAAVPTRRREERRSGRPVEATAARGPPVPV